MKLTLIVGAGGTGSYFIDEIVHYYNALNEPHAIVVVDGDVVEQKNLLRQGFLMRDLHKGKAEALVNRYNKIVREGVTIVARDEFIGSVNDVVEIATEQTYTDITLVSCVDNNMARLRLTFALYALRDICKCEVRFIDSGNEEWYGQTITSVLKKTGETYLQGLHAAVEEHGLQGAQQFQLKESNDRHILASIFTENDNWTSHLTRGDHELSCEDVTESNPQNIGTNMMASKCLLLTVSMLNRNEFVGGEFNYDANANTVTRKNDGVRMEPGYLERLKELLAYVATEEGHRDVFGQVEVVEPEVAPTVATVNGKKRKGKTAQSTTPTNLTQELFGDYEDDDDSYSDADAVDTEEDDLSLDLFDDLVGLDGIDDDFNLFGDIGDEGNDQQNTAGEDESDGNERPWQEHPVVKDWFSGTVQDSPGDTVMKKKHKTQAEIEAILGEFDIFN